MLKLNASYSKKVPADGEYTRFTYEQVLRKQKNDKHNHHEVHCKGCTFLQI